MAIWPITPTAIRSRISSYRRLLRQEAASPGGFGDDRGRRFLLFALYFQLREDTEVRAYIDWYRATFSEGDGHAESFLCWALILHRLGREDEAVYRFAQAIDENLPVIAEVVDDLHSPYGIWGEELWQMYRVDESVLAAMTADERDWLRSTWRSPTVTAMRLRHIALGQALVTEPVGTHRSAILTELRRLPQAFWPQEMPPFSTGDPMAWLTSGRAPSKPRSTRKLIRTTPEFWKREGSPAVPVEVPHEIVIRFQDRGPIRLRGMISRAEADEAARRMMGKILIGDGINVSLRTATGYAIVPDGQGPDGAEVVDLPRN